MTSVSSSSAGREPVSPTAMTRRVVIGVLLAVVGLGCVAWPPAFLALVLLIATGCLYEVTGLSSRKGATLAFPVAIAAVWAYIILTYLREIHHYEGILLAGTVVVALATATFTATRSYLAHAANTLLGVLYIGKLLTYFVLIRALTDGAAWMVWLIFIVAFTDIFAMLVGTAIGRHRLTRLSPKKTVEGAIGGFVFALVAGAAISLFPALHRMEEAGWLTSSWGESETNRRAKFYRLTKLGRRQLETETQQWERVSLAIASALRAT